MTDENIAKIYLIETKMVSKFSVGRGLEKKKG
jgi:hypothetical protein